MQHSSHEKKPIRSQMVRRSWFIVASMLVLGLVILGRVLFLQIVEKEALLKSIDGLKSKERTIVANRGNILASDGVGLLATTVPKFLVCFDPSRETSPKDTLVIKRKNKSDSLVLYAKQVDKLCTLLARNFKEKTKEEYKQIIMHGRKTGDREVQLIPRLVNVEESFLIGSFPFFKENKRLVGGILKRKYIREYPFGKTAKRTIGNVAANEEMKGVYGIEFSFNKVLSGTNGYGFYDKISGGYWRSTEANNEIQPEAGRDIVTTLDVNFQDIAETALLKQVNSSNAKYGTVVVMEIKTGEIKAIANYGRVTKNEQNYYVDNDNYAVKGNTDPGSTFKLVSMLALLEKTGLSPDSYAATCTGKVVHSKENHLNCSHKHGSLTVKQVFEQSCNVGVYQLMKKHFGFKKSSDFYDYIAKFRINEDINFQLKGAAKPDIIFPSDKGRFSHTTIPWMSIGYEMGLTPLQTLAFYNTIANNGYWVEPIIVKEVREDNKTKEVFKARTSSSPICSAKNVRLAKEMLEGVVLHGTAKNISEGHCTVAGKTGTAQKREGGYRNGSEVYTSFAGYFPANNPKYSCIVVVDEPQGGTLLYGSSIAAPVFREIADKIFAYDVTIHTTKKIQPNPKQLAKRLGSGASSDFGSLLKGFSITDKDIMDENSSKWVTTEKTTAESVRFKSINTSDSKVSVKGMVLRDALQVLENAGFTVAYSGKGKVSSYELTAPNRVALFLQ